MKVAAVNPNSNLFTGGICLGLLFWLLLMMPPPAKSEHLPVKIYTSADGLGSSFVNFLMSDSRGFMWFATRDGLSRFDGAQFITYKIKGDISPPGFESIFESKTGTYWVSTTAGLYYFDAGTISQSDPANKSHALLYAKFAGAKRGVMFEDPDGTLWFGSNTLFRVEMTDDKVDFISVDLHLPEQYQRGLNISDLNRAADGSLWLTSNFGIIRRLPDGRVIFYPLESALSQSNISLLIDKEERIWTTRLKEIFVFIPPLIESLGQLGEFTIENLKSSQLLKLEAGKEIQLPGTPGEVIQFSDNETPFLKYTTNKLFQSSDGIVWLTTKQGLYEFNQRRFRILTSEQGLLPSMTHVAEDSAGNLWFSGQAGLTRLDRKGLVSYGRADQLNSQNISAINQARDGTLYFATDDFYLSRFDGENFQTVRPAIAPGVQFSWLSRYALIDSRGDWWILSKVGLFRYSSLENFGALDGKKASAEFSTKTGLKSDAMFQIFEDSGGSIWLSLQSAPVEGRGLARLKPGEENFYQFTEADGFPPNKSATSFAEDARGNIWFGFYESGMARFAGGKFTVFGRENGLPNGLVTDLLVDKKGRLWISTSEAGLYYTDELSADQPNFLKLTTENGLSSNNIRTLTMDNFGDIYAGTVRGVDRISPDTMRIKHFSVNDGLASDFVVDSLCDKTGALWFATTNGLSKLAPTQTVNPTPPSIWLGGVRIAGVEQSISALGDTTFGNVELDHTQNNLQIDFFGLDFRTGETLRYQYKLEGADADWSALTELRTVTYANLQPAGYRFLVRAVNSEGLASPTPAAVSFKILPPVWARWWFISLGCLAALAILIALERYRARRLAELKTAFGELRVSENRFRNLVEQSPFGIIVLAPDGTIRAVNQAYLDIWGGSATREQILNWDMQNDEQLIQSGVVEVIERAFAGETVKAKPILYNFRKSPLNIQPVPGAAESAWLIGSVYPVKDANGHLLEVIAVLEDITARKTAEEKLERSRLERLIELEQVRARIATDLHDDIGASLTQIAVLSEVARAQKGQPGNGASGEPLTRISDVTNELVEAMSDIVWSINPAKDHLSDLTQRMRRFASDVFSAKGIGFHFESPDAGNEIIINTNLRREVFLIFKESVNNIVKHSGARHVDIEMKFSDRNLTLKIRDDGKGFAVRGFGENGSAGTENKGGNGILSMRKRAREMNGEVEIVSQIGGGTTLSLSLPYEQNLEH